MPESIWEQVEREFACEHTDTEIRYKLDKLSRRSYLKQCLNCGRATTSALPHSSIPDPSIIREFDELAEAAWYDLRQQRREELTAARRDGFFEDYSVYLNSPEWFRKRATVLKQDNYLCQGCRERTATTVHHLKGSYKYIPHEPLFMLVSLCTKCHDYITDTDREK